MSYQVARRLLVVTVLTGISLLAVAQEVRPAVDSGDLVKVQAERLPPDQLADLVAPIALYPDSLLSQVLVASTYPLEVVEAQQWLKRNGELQGRLLTDAALEQDWDASVEGLVAFPEVLAVLNQDVRWTTALGNAFLAQQSDVMAAVQRMRGRAQASAKLVSTPEQNVSTETKDGVTVVEVAPADPQLIYVPEYDPAEIWGAPAYGAYPALEYAPNYGFGPAMDIGFWFGPWAGWGWGWGPSWWGGSVWVNHGFFRHYGFHDGRGHHGGGGHGGGGHPPGGPHGGQVAGVQPWRHDSGHRQGVPYQNGGVSPRHQAVSTPRNSTGSPGSWRERGAGPAPQPGSRSVAPGSRSAEPRSPAPRSAARSTERQQWRNPQGAAREQVVRRNSPSVPRYTGSTPRYQPAPRAQSAPRSFAYAPHGGGSAPGGGGSYRSGGGSAPSTGGGHTSGGGSHGGARH